jgi:hypothetical protein
MAGVSNEVVETKNKVVVAPTTPSPSMCPSNCPFVVPLSLLYSPPLIFVPEAHRTPPFPMAPSPIVNPPSSPFYSSPSWSPSVNSEPKCSIRIEGDSEGVSFNSKRVSPPHKVGYSLISQGRQVNDYASYGSLTLDPIQQNPINRKSNLLKSQQKVVIDIRKGKHSTIKGVLGVRKSRKQAYS